MAGICPIALTFNLPVFAVPVIATLLSLGYDLTQPLFAGIVTDLSAQRGQAMGLNVFALFLGFGTASPIFGAMLPVVFETAFRVSAIVAILAGIFAFKLLKSKSHC